MSLSRDIIVKNTFIDFAPPAPRRGRSHSVPQRRAHDCGSTVLWSSGSGINEQGGDTPEVPSNLGAIGDTIGKPGQAPLDSTDSSRQQEKPRNVSADEAPLATGIQEGSDACCTGHEWRLCPGCNKRLSRNLSPCRYADSGRCTRKKKCAFCHRTHNNCMQKLSDKSVSTVAPVPSSHFSRHLREKACVFYKDALTWTPKQVLAALGAVCGVGMTTDQCSVDVEKLDPAAVAVCLEAAATHCGSFELAGKLGRHIAQQLCNTEHLAHLGDFVKRQLQNAMALNGVHAGVGFLRYGAQRCPERAEVLQRMRIDGRRLYFERCGKSCSNHSLSGEKLPDMWSKSEHADWCWPAELSRTRCGIADQLFWHIAFVQLRDYWTACVPECLYPVRRRLDPYRQHITRIAEKHLRPSSSVSASPQENFVATSGSRDFQQSPHFEGRHAGAPENASVGNTGFVPQVATRTIDAVPMVGPHAWQCQPWHNAPVAFVFSWVHQPAGHWWSAVQ